MKVYIEFVILDNLIINCLIILLTLHTVRTKIMPERVIFSAVFGTAIAIILPLCQFSLTLFYALKLSCGFIMALAMARYTSAKKYAYTTLIFFLITFFMGGICYGTLFMLQASVDKTFMHNASMPISIAIAPVFLGAFLLRRFVQKYQRVKKNLSFTYKADITYKQKTITAQCFLDSGNSIYDSLTNLPVCVGGGEILSKLVGEQAYEDILLGRRKGRWLDISTLGGTSKLFLIQPSCIKIYFEDKSHIFYDIMLGISFSPSQKHELILHPCVVLR